MTTAILKTRRGRVGLVAVVTAMLVPVIVWAVPDLSTIGDAFRAVAWKWVAASFLANIASTWLRALSWQVTLQQALPPPHPSHRNIASAFSVGLLGNAVLPGRVGEFTRVAVLSRRLPHGSTTWPAVAGSIFAHRVLDVIPIGALAIFILVAARLPSFAAPGLGLVLGIGGALLVAAVLLARRGSHGTASEQAGRIRNLLVMVRRGLGVFRAPAPAALASFLQVAAWALQLLAVWLALLAFGINEPIAAAALVLLVVNVTLAFPLWPGAVGLFQAAVALALLPYGVSYQHGFAAGIGIQAIEASVGIGLGLLFLAREGVSFATLKQMPRVTDGDVVDTLANQRKRESRPYRRQVRVRTAALRRSLSRRSPRPARRSSERRSRRLDTPHA